MVSSRNLKDHSCIIYKFWIAKQTNLDPKKGVKKEVVVYKSGCATAESHAWFDMSLVARKLVFLRVFYQVSLKPACSATEAS